MRPQDEKLNLLLECRFSLVRPQSLGYYNVFSPSTSGFQGKEEIVTAAISEGGTIGRLTHSTDFAPV